MKVAIGGTEMNEQGCLPINCGGPVSPAGHDLLPLHCTVKSKVCNMFTLYQ